MSVSYSISLESGAIWSSLGAACYGRLFKNRDRDIAVESIRSQTGDRKPVPVSVNVLVDATSSFGAEFLKLKDPDIKAYYHWLMNESAWSPCFLQRDLDTVRSDACFKFNTEVDATLMMSAMFVIRLPTYIYRFIPMWNKVFTDTGNPYLSTLMAYYVCPDNTDCIRSVSQIGGSDSNTFNKGSTKQALSAFIQGNPVFSKDSMMGASFKEQIRYKTTISTLMFPSGNVDVPSLIQEAIVSLSATAKQVMRTYQNPFISEDLESRISTGSEQRSSSVRVPFDRLPEVLARLV